MCLRDAFLVCRSIYSHCDPTLKAITKPCQCNANYTSCNPAIVVFWHSHTFLSPLPVYSLLLQCQATQVSATPTNTTIMRAAAAARRGSGLGMGTASGHRWLLVWMTVLLLVVPPHLVDGRYLPTRSHGDDLDKLRELMLQVSDGTLS